MPSITALSIIIPTLLIFDLSVNQRVFTDKTMYSLQYSLHRDVAQKQRIGS